MTTRGSRDSMEALLAARGVSRRDFLAYCGALAAAIGLGGAAAPAVAEAISLAAPRKPVVWLTMGACGGCTTSLLQSGQPDVPATVLELLSADYWETLMTASGEGAAAARAAAVERGGYLVVVEGAMMRGLDGNACRIAGKTGLEHLREVSANADAILAVGSCAVDGGWMAAAPHDWSAEGVGVKAMREYTNGKPVINLPTCPVNPEWLVAIVVDQLVRRKLPELDGLGRPRRLYSSTIHDACPRRGHFESGRFVEHLGSAEEADGLCLYKLGCKGPQTLAECPMTRWNRKASWCVEAGSPCIGCASPDWVGTGAPFGHRLPNVVGIRPETIGLALGAVAAGGLAAHGVARIASAVMRHGEDPVARGTKSDDPGAGGA